MSKMKKFLKYVILLLLLYLFSNLIINALFKVNYKEIENYEINVEECYVEVTEAKATIRNGYIYGIIKNNKEQTIENKYLKVSMLSKNNNVLGEKYIKLDKIEPQQLTKFEVKFDYDNVTSFKIEFTDTKPEDVDFLELVKTNASELVEIIKQ